MLVVYVGLGSNHGDRDAWLRRALAALPEIGVTPTRLSPVYETAPVDTASRQWFLNAVAEAHTALGPRQLLRRLRALERRLGRTAHPSRPAAAGRRRAAPRTLDLDLLLYGRVRMATPELTLPHPRLRDRRFALQPLADLAATRHLPGDAVSVTRRLHRAPRGFLRRALTRAPDGER